MELLSPSGEYTLIIEHAYDTFWAYLLDKNKEIISDCWIANESDIPERDSEYYRSNQAPPPAKEEYISEILEIKANDDFAVNWREDNQEVHLYINNDEVIKFNFKQNRGYNKFLKEDCPWGNHWG